jgi:hypothetical protein
MVFHSPINVNGRSQQGNLFNHLAGAMSEREGRCHPNDGSLRKGSDCGIIRAKEGVGPSTCIGHPGDR